MIRLIISLIFFLSTSAHAQLSDDGQYEVESSIQFSVEYLLDEQPSLSVNEALYSLYSPASNKQCFSLNSSTNWYKVTVTNPLASPANVFLHNNRGNLSKQVDIYDVINDGEIKAYHYDFFDKHVGTMLQGSIIVHPLTIPANDSKTILIKNDSLAYQCIDIEIHDNKSSIQALINNNLSSIIIVIILFTMAIYNLLLYSFIRRKEFIYYALYLINAAIGLTYYYGIIFHHFQLYGAYVYWLNITAITGSIFLVLFVQEIISTKKDYPSIHQLLNWVIIFSALDVLIAVLFSLSLASQLVFIVIAYSFIVLSYMIVKLFKDDHPLVLMFAFAYLAYILGMGIVLLMFMGILPLNEFTFHSSGMGIIIEVVLFSYLLHHRVRLLTQQKMKAEGANKRKTRFLASASHDLRQPVHALELFSASFIGEKLTTRGQETLFYMKESIASLSELLTSLLDISRLDAGIVEPSIGQTDVFTLITRLANNSKVHAENKGLKLHIKAQHLWVESDAILLENSLRNILTNAIKFTQKGGVLISCRPRKDQVWIEIWDTGIGMPEDQLEHVFDEFYQINSIVQNQKQGLGLGLSIVMREMDMLGHSLSIHSREGRGTLVRIKLQRIYPKFNLQSTLPKIATNSLENKKILIIDDEEAIVVATKGLMNNWGCIVETASNFANASAICQHFIPDVIISDFRLQEGANGIDVIKKLQLQLGQQIPAILVTGDTEVDKLQLAQESQLMLLHKPVKPAKLRVATNMVLNAHSR